VRRVMEIVAGPELAALDEKLVTYDRMADGLARGLKWKVDGGNLVLEGGKHRMVLEPLDADERVVQRVAGSLNKRLERGLADLIERSVKDARALLGDVREK